MRRACILVLVMLASCAGQSTTPPAGNTAASSTTTVTAAPSTIGPTTSLTCWQAPATTGVGAIEWEEATSSFGLVEPLTGMFGHAAAWGDVNGDDRADLVVGTFATRDPDAYLERGAEGPSPDVLLFGGEPFDRVAGFSDSLGRTSASVFADLDQDGDLDLVLIRNAGNDSGSLPPSQVFVNQDGRLSPATDLPFPEDFSGRSVAVADFDLDADLDLAVAEDRFGESGTRLLFNQGALVFVDVTDQSGLPSKLFGLGLAAADLTGDKAPDLFVGGAQQLFVNQGDGTFRLEDSDVFEWLPTGNEDDVAAVVLADVDRNGWPDILIGHHFNSTLNQDRPAPVRLFLHQGLDAGGDPEFEESTEESGLSALPTKAPHVEVVDLDNDGWPDILTTASAEDGELVAVFRNQGLADGVPRFEAPLGLGDPQYWVAGPTADVDRDGRVDVFLVEWEPSLPSRLLRNTSTGGHWLEVSIAGANTGVGSTITLYPEGALGDPGAAIGFQEIGVGVGYGAGRQPIAHFGLGDADKVDIVIEFPDGEKSELLAVDADQHLRWPNGC